MGENEPHVCQNLNSSISKEILKSVGKEQPVENWLTDTNRQFMEKETRVTFKHQNPLDLTHNKIAH